MAAEVESGPVRVERRDGIAIDIANRAIRVLAPAHAGHGVDYVHQTLPETVRAVCYCGETLTFAGEALARALRARVR